MHTISARNLRNLLTAVEGLAEDPCLSTLPQRSIAAVNRVAAADMVTYNDLDLVRRTDCIHSSPVDARLAPGSPDYLTFIRHIDEHPLIEHNARVVDPIPRKISDFLSTRRFRATALHCEFFSRLGLNYQIAVVIRHGAQHMIGIASNRSASDFTEAERTCLALLRPHLMQAYRLGLIVESFHRRDAYGISAGRLTRRELEILSWVAQGKSNGDIARIIGATAATVKKHLEHIFLKLGVENRTAATALYLKNVL